MTCTLSFWLLGLGSILTGVLLTWLYWRNRITHLKHRISTDADKIIQLENDYSSLRSSSKSQILSLKEERTELGEALPKNLEIHKKYSQLKVDYDGLKSKFHIAERSSSTGVSRRKYEELKGKYSSLRKEQDNTTNVEKSQKQKVPTQENLILELKELRKKNKRKAKKIKSLSRKIQKLNKKINNKVKPESVEREIKITKSLKVNKLLDWLKNDKAYKVKRKVSRQKFKKN